jgi:hypothetical protein
VKLATDLDHRIIDSTSWALISAGNPDDVDRLKQQILEGSSEDKLHTACVIAVAFIRWSQDLKQERDELRKNGLVE